MGAERRHVNEARNAALVRRPCDGARTESMHGFEVLAAGPGENANKIDHSVSTLESARDGSGVAQIRLDRVDLAHAPGRLQVPGKIGPPRRDANAPAALRELAHDLPADEAGAAENRDDPPGRNQSF